jgi:hypothetical protein
MAELEHRFDKPQPLLRIVLGGVLLILGRLSFM